MQTDVYVKIINEKMNMEFWMAGFLVIPKVYAVIASPFSTKKPKLSFTYCRFLHQNNLRTIPTQSFSKMTALKRL